MSLAVKPPYEFRITIGLPAYFGNNLAKVISARYWLPFISRNLSVSPLVEIYLKQGRLDEGVEAAKKAVSILEAAKGKDHVYVGVALERYATILEARNQGDDRQRAKEMRERAQAIFDKQKGPFSFTLNATAGSGSQKHDRTGEDNKQLSGSPLHASQWQFNRQLIPRHKHSLIFIPFQ